MGSEIQNGDSLNLDPTQIYNLYRPREELIKACETFNNLQLLDEHIPTSPNNPQQDKTVGTVGTDCLMDGNDMLGTVTVWTQDAIDQISIADTNPERGKKDLSCSYFYDLVPENGEFEGQKYDFKMVNIRGNHVALVPDGRVPTAMIADSDNNSIVKGSVMKKTKKLAHDGKGKDCNTMSDAEMSVAGEVKKIATDTNYEGKENERLAAIVNAVRDLTKIQREEAMAADSDEEEDKEDIDKAKAAADSDEEDKDDKKADDSEEEEKEDKKAIADAAINAAVSRELREIRHIEALCAQVLGGVSQSFAVDASKEELVRKTLKAKGFAADANYEVHKIQLETLAKMMEKNKSEVQAQLASDSSYRPDVKITSKSLFERN
jgi:hypothetical protein